MAKEYGFSPDRVMSGVGALAATPNAGGGLKVVKNDADYDAIPSGTEFIDDKGVRRRKR